MVEGLKVGRLRPDGSLPGQPHGPVGEQSDELSSEAGQPEQKIFILEKCFCCPCLDST